MSNAIQLPDTRPASQATVIEQSRAVAEVAAAVRVARDFPRDTNRIVDEMRALCARLAVAQRAFYSVPNRGSGLSIHIARELTRIWGNTDYGVRETARDDVKGESEMQAWAWDQEKNVRSTRSFIVPHAKSTRKGRQNLIDLHDIYLNNQNVGAKAVRECIFGLLPEWFKHEAEMLLSQTLANGDGKPVEQRREEAVAAFRDMKVTLPQLETFLTKKMGQWGPNDLAELARAHASIKQDGIAAAEFFPEKAVEIAA